MVFSVTHDTESRIYTYLTGWFQSCKEQVTSISSYDMIKTEITYWKILLRIGTASRWLQHKIISSTPLSEEGASLHYKYLKRSLGKNEREYGRFRNTVSTIPTKKSPSQQIRKSDSNLQGELHSVNL